MALLALLGVGDGGFQLPVPYGAGPSPYCAAVGDFNGDGQMDLAVGSEGFVATGLSVVNTVLGSADGGFRPSQVLPVGLNPTSLSVADLNGDGHADLVVANYGSSTVSLLLGNGDGTFRPKVDLPAAAGPSSVAVGDFNRDGKLDLAVTSAGTATVSVFLNTCL